RCAPSTFPCVEWCAWKPHRYSKGIGSRFARCCLILQPGTGSFSGTIRERDERPDSRGAGMPPRGLSDGRLGIETGRHGGR
ncbi:MAG TPA: hypothetical protein PLI53_03570, partial [Geobacteraceae bacterium]|nr:hypothetical protein [Geobacteraceae bacterium]